MRSDETKAKGAVNYRGIVLALATVIASPTFANEIDQMANNLEASCSNHFRKRPNKPSNDSRKFCSCFAGVFTSTVSLRDLDAASGVVTPEIQEQFERAADACSYDISPAVVQSGRAWIAETN
jgi:hypothetical protein